MDRARRAVPSFQDLAMDLLDLITALGTIAVVIAALCYPLWPRGHGRHGRRD